jgi:hypothetical protein
VDGDGSAEQLGALAHAEQSESARLDGRVKPVAVVSDGYVDRLVALDDLDHRSVCQTVLGRVRQRLLHDSVDRGPKIGGMAGDRTAAFVGALDADIDRETLGFKSLGQNSDCRLGAELLGRSQIRD